MTDEWSIGKHLGGYGCGLIQADFTGGTAEKHENLSLSG
jgi:hypothetical protein